MTSEPRTPSPGDRPGEEPAPSPRDLQNELEAARRGGHPIPYETLAALAAAIGDLRRKIRFIESVVDRSGLVFAKDTRALLARLTADLDATAAKVAGLEHAVQDLRDGGSRVPAPRWDRMDQAELAAQLAALSEWVARVLVPRHVALTPGAELPPCWRAHEAVVWELGTLWAEWRRVYDRTAPELGGALDLSNRWAAGTLERVYRALSKCTHRQCILTLDETLRRSR